MLKVTVTFEQDGKVFRKVSTEGSALDVLTMLGALEAEFQVRAQGAQESAEGVCTCGQDHGAMQPEIEEMQRRLEANLSTEQLMALRTTMEEGMDQAFERFLSALKEGRVRLDGMVDFVVADIRQQWLSVLPDFPEKLLDESLALARKALGGDDRLRRLGPV